MQREHLREYSQALGRDTELLRFGHAGRPLLVFPTSMGRFFQWEDFGLVGALGDWIDVELLARYVDQTFSWIDAIVLLSVDDDRRVEKLWTVDSALGAYRFSHQVAVTSPGS